MCLAGLGPVLVPLSSVMAGACGVLPPHITAALQSLGPGGNGSAPPQPPNMLPSAPVLPAPSVSQLLQQAAVNQVMQQVAAAAPNMSSGQAVQSNSGVGTTAGRGRLAAPHPGVASTSLAALVPHVPQLAPPPHATAAMPVAAAAAKSEASAPSAGTASYTSALRCWLTWTCTVQIQKWRRATDELVYSQLAWCSQYMLLISEQKKIWHSWLLIVSSVGAATAGFMMSQKGTMAACAFLFSSGTTVYPV